MVSVGGFSNSNASLALTLLGGSVASHGAPTMAAQVGYKPFIQGEPQKIAAFTKQSSFQQAVTYFKTHITQAKTVDDVVHDPKLVNFILTAFNLQDDAQYPAKVKAILNSDLSDRRSYANSLIDPRYQQFAKEFNAHQLGMANFHSGTTIDDLVGKYTTNSYESSLDDVNPALHNAAYFLRNIGGITDAYSILGDPVFRDVVTTALGLPTTIANLPVQDQRALINSKLDVTKLETNGAAPSSPASAALAAANQDAAAVLNNRNVVGAAEAAVQTVDERIAALQKDYKDLAAVQDPNGQYAAEIPVQQAAAPVLVEQQALLNAAQKAIGTVGGDLAQLQTLIRQAGSSGNMTPLTQLKAQVQDLHDQIVSAVAGASYQFDDGTGGASTTTENLIDGSLSAPISVQYDSAGHSVAVNPRNLGAGSSFQSQLDAANAAFQSLTGMPSDSAIIQTATAAVSAAQTASGVTAQGVTTDAAKFSQAIAAVPRWAGTYDSAALSRGVQSLADAGLRITQINQLLVQIHGVADKSAQLDPGDDRTALQSQYDDLIAKLGTAIDTPGQPGLDNLLAANPDPASPDHYSYAIDPQGKFTIQARTSDLVSGILTPLAGADVSSLVDAHAVLGMIDGGVQSAIAAAGQFLAADSPTFSLPAATLDPRTAVDSRYRQLASDMAGLVATAAWNGANLLDPHQARISFTVASANMSITIAPATTYGADVTQTIAAGSQALPSDTGDSSGALAQLESARFANARLLGSLNQQLAQLDLASGLTKAQIARLTNQQKPATAAGTPFNATSSAVQLVQKYLAQVDSKAAAGAAGGTGGINSYALQLLQGVN